MDAEYLTVAEIAGMLKLDQQNGAELDRPRGTAGGAGRFASGAGPTV